VETRQALRAFLSLRQALCFRRCFAWERFEEARERAFACSRCVRRQRRQRSRIFSLLTGFFTGGTGSPRGSRNPAACLGFRAADVKATYHKKLNPRGSREAGVGGVTASDRKSKGPVWRGKTGKPPAASTAESGRFPRSTHTAGRLARIAFAMLRPAQRRESTPALRGHGRANVSWTRQPASKSRRCSAPHALRWCWGALLSAPQTPLNYAVRGIAGRLRAAALHSSSCAARAVGVAHRSGCRACRPSASPILLALPRFLYLRPVGGIAPAIGAAAVAGGVSIRLGVAALRPRRPRSRASRARSALSRSFALARKRCGGAARASALSRSPRSGWQPGLPANHVPPRFPSKKQEKPRLRAKGRR